MMPGQLRRRSIIAGFLFVSLALAPSGGAQDPNDDPARVIMLLTDIVIPAAVQDFATLKSNRVSYEGFPRSWNTTLRLPKNWDSWITDHDWAVEFIIRFANQTHKDPSWLFDANGGAWLEPLYEGLRAVLDNLMKEGWKKKTTNDRRYSDDDNQTGSETRWTRRDGLVVRLERYQTYDREAVRSNKRSLTRNANNVVDVSLLITVSKPR